MYRKAKLLGVALGAFLALGGATAARAQEYHRDCDRRIAHERRELDRAIDRYGSRSRAANHERRELRRLYRQCGYRDDDHYLYRDYDRDRYRDPD